MAKQKESIKSKLDLYDRLNSTTSVEQIRNARAVVERLRNDRWRYFEEGSKPFARWKEGCDELYQLINRFPASLHIDCNDMDVVLEKFIEAFEHHERRFRQILQTKSIPDSSREKITTDVSFWFDALFRFSVYGILLEKQGKRGEEQIIRTKITITTPKDVWLDTSKTKTSNAFQATAFFVVVVLITLTVLSLVMGVSLSSVAEYLGG